ncbi:MAG TPA: lanthionine synthetase LanC family protein, partial [Ktedonobacteraceae bacterium]|nr:lanthionine synthetase LanC family protein [Ktedonobacteraceae bacterium]
LLPEGFGKNHSLCHGDLGNLDILLSIARHLPEICSGEALLPLQSTLLENLTAQERRSGIPGGIEVPGLMLGIAGTGYALLRQVAPERVPSILLLASPHPGTYEI